MVEKKYKLCAFPGCESPKYSTASMCGFHHRARVSITNVKNNPKWNPINNPKNNHINNPKRKRRDQKLPLIYLLENPAWPGWYKVGYSDNWYSRKSAYQTGCPLKDYEEAYRFEHVYAKPVEKLYHIYKGRKNGEWVNESLDQIIEQLELLFIEYENGIDH